MRALLVTLIAAASLAATPPAAQATKFKGRTGQHRGATVRTGADGVVRSIKLGWKARCNGTRRLFRNRTVFRAPFDRSSPSRVVDRGAYTIRYKQGFRVRVKPVMSALRRSEFRWRGTLRIKLTARHHGRLLTRCRVKKTGWRASIPEATVELTSDEGDYIGAGGTYSYRTPEDALDVVGGRRQLKVEGAPYGIEVEAPKGQSLKSGSSFATTRYPFNDEGGGLDVSGDGRGCNKSTGTVTVESAAYTRKGHLKSIALTFEQHCDGAEPALRGRFSYRR